MTHPATNDPSPDHDLARLLAYLKPNQEDPTYLVLKAHLLAEEAMVKFLESQAIRPQSVSDARLGFAQMIALTRAFHRFSAEDWWGWLALQKLNSLRNQLAHKLEPQDLDARILEFTVLVASPLSKRKPELDEEYRRLVGAGARPFILSLVALHIALCATLGFEPAKYFASIKNAP